MRIINLPGADRELAKAVAYHLKKRPRRAPATADIDHSRWVVEKIMAGRMKAVPAEDVLAEFDRIAESGLENSIRTSLPSSTGASMKPSPERPYASC